MTLTRMFDASSPPLSAYPGCGAVAGYIGGNTPHVWDSEEWRNFQGLRQFPIYVGFARTDGIADGNEAVQRLHTLGWAAHQENRRIVFLDMESQINAGYVDQFAQVIWDAGFETGVYESLSAYSHNPSKEGVWLAEWDGQADLPPLDYVVAHQYAPNIPYEETEIDLSVVSDDLLLHGGVGPRH